MKDLNKPFKFIDRPLWFHKQGLSQTASGYGSRLVSPRCILIDGEKRPRRVYVICYSNAGTAYVRIKGEQFTVNEYDATTK